MEVIDDLKLLRRKRIIDQALQDFELDLSDLKVLTEVGSNDYLFTPIIASMAGAEHVFAWTRDSEHGRSKDLLSKLRAIEAEWSTPGNITVGPPRDLEDIAQADIITNSGFVRPIDDELIAAMKPTAVVPLMWETWEFRPSEVDLQSARDHGILVLGTNEKFLYRNNGFLATKLLFEAGHGVWKDKLLIVASGRIGQSLSWYFRQVGVEHDRVSLHTSTIPAFEPSVVPVDQARKDLESYDAIIIAEHHDPRSIVGPDGLFTPSELEGRQPLPTLIHICGEVDAESVARSDLRCHPPEPAPFGHMTISAADLDSHAVLELNTAGLRVGELMARSRRAHDLEAAYRTVRDHPLVDDFPTGYLDTSQSSDR